MRAAIYNPYLDTLGGGERYSMAFASALSENGFKVDVQWPDLKIKGRLEARFGIALKNISIISDVKRGDGYDVIFWVSDGSIPILRARHNFLHFQVPFTNVGGRSLMNRMKLFRMEKIICNSQFTKKMIDKEYGVSSIVIYPPVDTTGIRPTAKKNEIISVGRFSQLTQAKRQDVLLDIFKTLCQKDLEGWKLIMAGGSEVGGTSYAGKLRKKAKDYPVEIIENPDFEKIKDLYGEARLFWSASGYGIDEAKEPKKVEHFGIAVVEAMSAGAIPLVFDAGGHKEMIEDGVSGFLWTSKRELAAKTRLLIKDLRLYKKIAGQCIAKSRQFSYKNFNEAVSSLIK